jgi:hypothetical protein
MAMVPCPDCNEPIPAGGWWCPFCQHKVRSEFERSLAPAFRPFAAGGKSWGSSQFFLVGIVAAVVSGGAASAYNSTGDAGWLSASSGAGVLALIWLLIGAVARGVAVGMREHDEG